MEIIYSKSQQCASCHEQAGYWLIVQDGEYICPNCAEADGVLSARELCEAVCLVVFFHFPRK